MKSSVKEFPIEKFAYMRRTGVYGEENYKLMASLKEWAKAQNLLNENTVIYGIARDNPDTTLPENCRYDVGIVIDNDFIETNGVDIGEVSSGGKYLVFTIEHTPQEVNEFWRSFFEISQKNGQEIDNNRPILEKYAKVLVDTGFCEMCVPIK